MKPPIRRCILVPRSPSELTALVEREWKKKTSRPDDVTWEVVGGTGAYSAVVLRSGRLVGEGADAYMASCLSEDIEERVYFIASFDPERAEGTSDVLVRGVRKSRGPKPKALELLRELGLELPFDA